MIISGTATLKSQLLDGEGKTITEVVDGNGRVKAVVYDKLPEGALVHILVGLAMTSGTLDVKNV